MFFIRLLLQLTICANLSLLIKSSSTNLQSSSISTNTTVINMIILADGTQLLGKREGSIMTFKGIRFAQSPV